jgi:hypothetical protein
MNVVEIPTAEIDYQGDRSLVRFQQLGTDTYKKSVMELAANISKLGLLQPITVRKKSDGRYTVLAGNRRLAACKEILSYAAMPCIVAEADDFEIAFSEQVMRSDLTEVERGDWIEKYIGRMKDDPVYKGEKKPIDSIMKYLSGLLGMAPRTLQLWRSMAKGLGPEERKRIQAGESPTAVHQEQMAVSGRRGGRPRRDGTEAKTKVLTEDEKQKRLYGKEIKKVEKSFVAAAVKIRENLRFIAENAVEYSNNKQVKAEIGLLDKALLAAQKYLK